MKLGQVDGVHLQERSCGSKLRDCRICEPRFRWHNPSVRTSPLGASGQDVDAQARGHGFVERTPCSAGGKRTSCSGGGRGCVLGAITDRGLGLGAEVV